MGRVAAGLVWESLWDSTARCGLLVLYLGSVVMTIGMVYLFYCIGAGCNLLAGVPLVIGSLPPSDLCPASPQPG